MYEILKNNAFENLSPVSVRLDVDDLSVLIAKQIAT
jgi:hypothetical protein